MQPADPKHFLLNVFNVTLTSDACKGAAGGAGVVEGVYPDQSNTCGGDDDEPAVAGDASAPPPAHPASTPTANIDTAIRLMPHTVAARSGTRRESRRAGRHPKRRARGHRPEKVRHRPHRRERQRHVDVLVRPIDSRAVRTCAPTADTLRCRWTHLGCLTHVASLHSQPFKAPGTDSTAVTSGFGADHATFRGATDADLVQIQCDVAAVLLHDSVFRV